MVRTAKYGALIGFLGLCACASGVPDIPVTQPRAEAGRPDVEPVKDWENWGREENRAARAAQIPGDVLTGAQISAALGGEVLRGCYPNGTPFAEYLATNGNFYDAANNNAQLGTWQVAEDALCFTYPQQGQSCFAVFRRGSAYDFYTTDLADKVASTDC